MTIVRTLAVAAALLVFSHASAAPDVNQLGKDRVAAAERVYQSTVALMKTGRAVVEIVYAWSIRLLDAELANGKAAKLAFADHLARMTSLDVEQAKAKASGQASAVDADAAGYFKIEAEYWVARGKR